MTYRSLLVVLDNSVECTARTQVALRLAREHDCHLVGLAPTGLIDIPRSSESASALADYAALAWDALRDQAEFATDRFREQCRVAGVTSVEVVIDEADKAPSIVRHAHCSDLVVLSQAQPGAIDHPSQQALVERVILDSARPTLLLPHTGAFAHVGTKVLVAWDDSREAARALADALPILVQASRVELVRWREDTTDSDTLLHARLEAVFRWLQRHGVGSHCHLATSHRGIAETILARAAEMDADLIVMGAYGHARWAERVLGGATRGTLRSMSMPMLMSH